MLIGRFGDTSHSPYIEAQIYLPRLKITGDVSFLVDTGADSSMLMPADAIRLGVCFTDLEGDVAIDGIGGSIHCFPERAVLVFLEAGVALHVYDLEEFSIMQNDPGVTELPSILGRDVLNRWRMIYDPGMNKLHAVVRSADRKLPLPKPAKKQTGP